MRFLAAVESTMMNVSVAKVSSTCPSFNEGFSSNDQISKGDNEIGNSEIINYDDNDTVVKTNSVALKLSRDFLRDLVSRTCRHGT